MLEKKKADISYMKFGELEGVSKFTWQLNPCHPNAVEFHDPTMRENGVQKTKSIDDQQHQHKKLCLGHY